MTKEEKKAQRLEEIHAKRRRLQAAMDSGSPITKKRGANPQIVCPHCQVKGQVSTRSVRLKRGISGGKATGALFTLGLSMLATGLSRKEQATASKCGNCGSEWVF